MVENQRRRSTRNVARKRYTDDAFETIDGIFQEIGTDIMPRGASREVGTREEELEEDDPGDSDDDEFQGSVADGEDDEEEDEEGEASAGASEAQNCDSEKQGDGDTDEDEDDDSSREPDADRRDNPTTREESPIVVEAGAATKPQGSRYGKGLLLRFEEMFLDEDTKTRASKDRLRLAECLTLPKRSAIESGALYTDEEMDKDCRTDWDWWERDSTRRRVMDVQKGESLPDAGGLSRYLPGAQSQHSFLIGPALNLRSIILKRFKAISLDRCWEGDQTMQSGRETREDDDVMHLDPPARGSKSRTTRKSKHAPAHAIVAQPRVSNRSGWIINLGAKAHCTQWIPKWQHDGYQYLAIATRPLAKLIPDVPPDLKEKVEKKRVDLETERENVYLSPKPKSRGKAPLTAVTDSSIDPQLLEDIPAPQPPKQSYTERFPPGAGALQIWRFAQQQTAEGYTQFAISEPPEICAAFASTTWGHVRYFQVCPFPPLQSSQLEIFIACVWSDGVLRLHILAGCRPSDGPLLNSSQHLIKVNKPAVEFKVAGAQSMVTWWYDGKTILSGNLDGSVTMFDIEKAAKGTGSSVVATYRYDASPIIFLGTCHPTYPSLIYTSSLSGQIRIFSHQPVISEASPPADNLEGDPTAHPPGDSSTFDRTSKASLLRFYSCSRTLRFRHLSPTALTFYAPLNTILLSSHAHSDHALLSIPLSPLSFPQTQSILRFWAAPMTCLATVGAPTYAHSGVIMGFADGMVRVMGSSLVMRGLRVKYAPLTQRVLAHEFSRVARPRDHAEKGEEEGMSRFLEGFLPERGDPENPYATTEAQAKTAKTAVASKAKGKGTRGKLTYSEMGGAQKQMHVASSEKAFEERSSVVSVAWNPNLGPEIGEEASGSAGTAGWVALAFGSGLLRVQDLSL